MNNWYNEKVDIDFINQNFNGNCNEWDNNSIFGGVKEKIKKHLLNINSEKCFYCKVKFIPEHFPPAIEHIVPKSLYPQFTFLPENLTIACDRCNSFKKDKEVLLNPDKTIRVYPPNQTGFLIVHAYFDEYENHISLQDNIFYVHLTEKGARTISLCNLISFSLILSNAKELYESTEEVAVARNLCQAHEHETVNSLIESIAGIFAKSEHAVYEVVDIERIAKLKHIEIAKSYENTNKDFEFTKMVYRTLQDARSKTSIPDIFDKIHQEELFERLICFTNEKCKAVNEFINFVDSKKSFTEDELSTWIINIDDISLLIDTLSDIKRKPSLKSLVSGLDVDLVNIEKGNDLIPYIDKVLLIRSVLIEFDSKTYYKQNKIKDYIDIIKELKKKLA